MYRVNRTPRSSIDCPVARDTSQPIETVVVYIGTEALLISRVMSYRSLHSEDVAMHETRADVNYSGPLGFELRGGLALNINTLADTARKRLRYIEQKGIY